MFTKNFYSKEIVTKMENLATIHSEFFSRELDYY